MSDLHSTIADLVKRMQRLEAIEGDGSSSFTSPLTTRGDLLTQNPSGTHIRLAIGAVAKYLRSNGTDPLWSVLLFSDLTYSGLTAGQVLRATGASAAAFGAVDLADSNAVTGILPGTNGGTGANNGSAVLTVPATGTAALLGRDQTFTGAQSFDGGMFPKQSVAVSTTLTVPSGYGPCVADHMTVDGTLIVNGDLAIV